MRNTGQLSSRTPKATMSVLLTCLLAICATTSVALAQDPPPPQQAPNTTEASSNPEEDFKAGRAAYEGNDWFSAIPILRRAANAGHLPSMVMLGTILNRAAETNEGVLWYHKAAQAGSLDGAYWLGTTLAVETEAADQIKKTAKDKKTTQDNQPDPNLPNGPEDALKWLNLAAEGNHPEAMFSMFNIHAQGKLGQLVDPKIALDWLQRSADKGFIPAMKELAKANAQGLFGLTPNPTEAQRWNKAVQDLEKAAAKSAPKPTTPNPGSAKK